MGRWAAEELLRRLDDPESAPVQHRMPCPVSRRASVAPPA
jgi:LacI family transcriptional regulator